MQYYHKDEIYAFKLAKKLFNGLFQWENKNYLTFDVIIWPRLAMLVMSCNTM